MREVGLRPKSDIPTVGHDLRNSARRALHCPVTLRLGSRKYCGETIDISANGVLLRTRCPVTSGSRVNYTIELPGVPFRMKTSVKVNCEGRVVRCSPSSNGAGQDVAIVIDD